MPLTLVVPHLPSAWDFYHSVLRPLGYRFIDGERGIIGLGIREANFFLEQADRGRTPKPSQIRFHASSSVEVRECYASALYAGGRAVRSPADHGAKKEVFNAQFLDPFGNNVEITFSIPDHEDFDGSEIDRSAVLSWQKGVATAPRSEATAARSKTDHTRVSARQSVAPDAHRSQAGSKHQSSKVSARSAAPAAGSKAASSHTALEVVAPSQPQLPGSVVSAAGSRAASSAPEDAHTSQAGSKHQPSKVSARSVVSAAGSKAASSHTILEVVLPSQSQIQQGQNIMPALCRHLSGPIEQLLTSTADPISGTVPIKTVVGTVLGAAAGAAFAYAMCSSEDGKVQHEQFRLSKWGDDGAPIFSQSGSNLTEIARIAQSVSGMPLPMAEQFSRLALEAPTQASAAVQSVHTLPGSPVQSHASRSRSQRSESQRSHRSRSSATLVADQQASQHHKDIDADLETVLPSDSISCAGDKYAERGMMRASGGSRHGSNHRSSRYSGDALGRIEEGDRRSEPRRYSARGTSRMN